MNFCDVVNVRYLRRSLAAVGGRFHGLVNPTRSSGIRTVAVTVNSK